MLLGDALLPLPEANVLDILQKKLKWDRMLNSFQLDLKIVQQLVSDFKKMIIPTHKER